ncbi:MAG: hypothetical protein OXG51_10020 [Gammaproteobacteria bacterium]|nr:hypothetical protein [Gammaproteobacteria bacterium]
MPPAWLVGDRLAAGFAGGFGRAFEWRGAGLAATARPFKRSFWPG